VGDFDRDGHTDIALASVEFGDLHVWFGGGDGTFGPPLELTSQFVSPVDLLMVAADKSSKTSLVVVDEGTYGVPPSLVMVDIERDRTMHISSSVQLYGTDYGLAGSVSVADINGDGIPDFLITVDFGIEVLLSNDSGTWSPNGILDTWDYTGNFSGDFNEDGITDLIAQDPSGAYTPLQLFLGNGKGGFSDAGSIGPASGFVFPFVIGDLNDDGHLDILVNSGWWSGPEAWVSFIGRGDGTFAAGPSVNLGGSTPYGLWDLNGDGHLDYVGNDQVGSGWQEILSSGSVRLALGNGDSTFQPWWDIEMDGGVSGVAVGDVNDDGWPDLIVSDGTSQVVSVFLNNCR
jgi:hypothetical protein